LLIEHAAIAQYLTDGFVIDATTQAGEENVSDLAQMQWWIKCFETDDLESHHLRHAVAAHNQGTLVKETTHALTLKAPHITTDGAGVSARLAAALSSRYRLLQ